MITPRTDAQETTGDRMQYAGVVSVSFARQLEQELAETKELLRQSNERFLKEQGEHIATKNKNFRLREAMKEILGRCQITGMSFESQSHCNTETARKALSNDQK